MELNTYLIFDGNCEEAFEFYKSVFGGAYSSLSRYRDMPSEIYDGTPAERIMHVSLPVGKSILMGSDSSVTSGSKVMQGDNSFISISPDSEEDATRIFKNLSEGGQTLMPLKKTFWGSLFGMITDRFGIRWMVSCNLSDSE